MAALLQGKLPILTMNARHLMSRAKILDSTVPTYFYAAGGAAFDNTYAGQMTRYHSDVDSDGTPTQRYRPPDDWPAAGELLRLPKTVFFLTVMHPAIIAGSNPAPMRVESWATLAVALKDLFDARNLLAPIRERIIFMPNGDGSEFGGFNYGANNSSTRGWLQLLTPRTEHVSGADNFTLIDPVTLATVTKDVPQGFLGTDNLNIVIFQDLARGTSYDRFPEIGNADGSGFTEYPALFATDVAQLLLGLRQFARTKTWLFLETALPVDTDASNLSEDIVIDTTSYLQSGNPWPQAGTTVRREYRLTDLTKPNQLVGLHTYTYDPTANRFAAMLDWQEGILKQLALDLADVGFEYKGRVNYNDFAGVDDDGFASINFGGTDMLRDAILDYWGIG